MSTPEFLPVLSSGAHEDPKTGACFMEYASFLAGETFSDSPQCADPFLTSVCQQVNDRCTDKERATIAHLIPRVIGTRQDGDMRKVHVQLACWAARRVLHLVRPQDRGVCAAAIEAAEGWCRGEAGIAEVKSAADAARAARAAAYAAARAARAAADAARAARAAREVAAAAAYAADAAYTAADAARAAYAAYAAYAAHAANAAAYAYAAACAADWKPAEFLADLFDEFERLTGHAPAPVSAEQWAAACALTA